MSGLRLLALALVAPILLLASAAWPWFDPLLGGPLLPHPGRLALAVALLALAAGIRRRPRLLLLAALAAVAIYLHAFLSLALQSPAPLVMAEQNRQYGRILSFSRDFLAANRGADPAYAADLEPEGLSGRLQTALRFSRLGYWTGLAGAAVLLAAAAREAARQSRRALALVALGTLVVAALAAMLPVSVFLAVALRAAEVDRALLSQDPAGAVRSADAALALSDQAALAEPLHLRRGEALLALGRTTDPAARLFVASLEVDGRAREMALAELRLAAADSSGALATVIRRRLGRVLAEDGLRRFRRQRLASAVQVWEEALAVDPERAEVAFFLAHAYHEQGRYGQAIDVSRRLQAWSRSRHFLADVEAGMGDSWTRLGDFNRAREAYRAAFRHDPRDNFRIYRSLGGT